MQKVQTNHIANYDKIFQDIKTLNFHCHKLNIDKNNHISHIGMLYHKEIDEIKEYLWISRYDLFHGRYILKDGTVRQIENNDIRKKLIEIFKDGYKVSQNSYK